MKKLFVLATLFIFVAPLVMAQEAKKDSKAVSVEFTLEQVKEFPQISQELVATFFENLSKNIKETKLKKAVLPEGVEDTAAIDAILPFITAVKQDYYTLATKDVQAARFVGNMLYTVKFHVKNGSFTIPEFIVKYRSYAETRTDLDDFYNDIFADAEASKK